MNLIRFKDTCSLIKKIGRCDMMKNNIIIYISRDGNVKVDVNILQDDIWMSQDIMANLYDTLRITFLCI